MFERQCTLKEASELSDSIKSMQERILDMELEKRRLMAYADQLGREIEELNF